ncbi:hypothetical protein [Acidipila sp. EB88]|uniref:hypothetical protein n=1 Tax=Acidipila sp. EB88 TaxID=2305226 RepID=UPI000F5E9A9E|nr:hypothetical protein [Acidipila sp. EB88]RRA48097.1 hypothetical protein D1Y84_07145 [Acidipila sp. EB88]
MVAQVVAVSDVTTDEPHPFRFAWPSAGAQADAEASMHALALRALATAARATFGPAAKTDQALQQAAQAAEAASAARAKATAAQGGPGAAAAGVAAGAAPGAASTGTARTRAAAKARAAKAVAAVADPLRDEQFSAFELSYGAGATFVYTAHTDASGADRRYVVVIAQPDFYGRPHAVFTQTTRGDMLGQTPALRLVDAVDADGDHRAELLFDALGNEGAGSGSAVERTAATTAASGTERQFALYRVLAGRATLLYASNPAMQP